MVEVSRPENWSVETNLSVASDASMASEAKPPIPTAAPRASIGAIAERAKELMEETLAPV